MSGGDPAAAQAAVLGPVHSLAVWLAVAVILIIYSRLSEHLAVMLGFNMYLVLILSMFAFLLMIPTGGLLRALQAKPGVYLTLFTAWLLLITPFSVWKGGSVQLLRDYWLKSYALYLVLAGLLVTAGHCRKVLYAMCVAGIIVEVFALLERASPLERLQLGAGSLSNPNELAIYLLFGLPGCLLLILNGRPFSFLRLVGLASAAMMLLLAFRTGSRMGLVTIIVVLIFLFLTASFRNKAKIVVATIFLALIAFTTSGPAIIQRYQTILGEPSPEEELSSEAVKAEGSTQARKNLLKASLIITMQHPIVGVGPGMFNVAAADDPYTARMLFAAWRETHNTFTQVSSETGIPGFVLYFAVVICLFSILLRICRQSRGRKDMEGYFRLAYCLMLALLIFVTAGMFGSGAYGFFLPTLAGVTAALGRIASQDALLISPNQGILSTSALPGGPRTRSEMLTAQRRA